jgi:hypothetical protein
MLEGLGLGEFGGTAVVVLIARYLSLCQPPNKQLQRTVQTASRLAARASFHYVHAARFIRQRAAAELRRYASGPPVLSEDWLFRA